ncbi:MAG: response regulator transcription factor [Chloroflexota bacterium]
MTERSLLDRERSLTSPPQSPPETTWTVGAALVVEDDQRSAALMQSILEDVARRVVVVNNAMSALDALAESVFDVVTLDIGLPDLTGLELLHHIRELTDAPVIMVTAVDISSSIVEALKSGADDYLVKPIHPAELRARIEAVTRRTRPREQTVEQYTDGHLLIDFARAVVERDGFVNTLSATERRLLHALVTHAGRVLMYEEVIKQVWGAGYEGTQANLHVFVSYLRKKVNAPADSHRYIRTHRAIGYEFVPLP